MSKSGPDSAPTLGDGQGENDASVPSGVVGGYRQNAIGRTLLTGGELRADAADFDEDSVGVSERTSSSPVSAVSMMAALAPSDAPVFEMLRDARVTHDIPLPAPSERGARLRGSLVPPVDVPAVVTLIVFAWHNANPGPLHWSFANVEEAARAAGVLRNAVGWAVVRGDESDVNRARLVGGVLLEQDVGQVQ